jgi:putative Ca2+/H+ antiporter (TMEM165/GDT1 family)
MDSVLLTMIATFVAELGDRTQLLVALLVVRTGRPGAIFAGFAAATAINCALSVLVGSFFASVISGHALMMFQALALAFAAFAMLWPRLSLDRLEGWRMAPFWLALLGCLVLEFGDKSQFLVIAAAARADLPSLAGLGGAIGIAAAALPAIAFARRIEGWPPLTWLRRAGGIGFAVAAVAIGMAAL